MVDIAKVPTGRTNSDIFIREGMSESLERGIEDFLQSCSASYTTASKKYSIWRLLRDHLDAAAAETLNCESNSFCLDTQFSKWLKPRKAAQVSLFFKLAIRSNQRSKKLIANLEALLELSHFVLERKSKKRIISSALRGARQINYRKQYDLRHYPYCELCWRLSRAAERDILNPESTLATLRFCIEHDPSVIGSKYRSDHRFRAKFHCELEKIRKQKNPENLDEIGIRISAYKNSHLSPTSLGPTIRKMYERGSSQSEIARSLNISRQAVSKSLS